MSELARWEDVTEELFVRRDMKQIDGHEAIAENLETLARRWRERVVIAFDVHCVEGSVCRFSVNYRDGTTELVTEMRGDLEIEVRTPADAGHERHLEVVVADDDERPTPPFGVPGTVEVEISDGVPIEDEDSDEATDPEETS